MKKITKGDKLLCKKDLIEIRSLGLNNETYREYSVKLCNKGAYYTVIDTYIYDNILIKIKTNLNFHNFRTGDYAGDYLWDYFYTDKEVRKLKLDNINENR